LKCCHKNKKSNVQSLTTISLINICICPGANPAIMSYNASAVKIYDASSGLAFFENKNGSLLVKNALAYYSAGDVVVILEVVGLASGF
jgi:hypothetical protein